MDADAAGTGAEWRMTRGGSRSRGRVVALVVAAALATAACADDDPGAAVRAIEARTSGAGLVAAPRSPATDPDTTPAGTTSPGIDPGSEVGADGGLVEVTSGDAPTVTSEPALEVPVPIDPAAIQFIETFDGNAGLDRFRFGVYHRDAGHHEFGRTPQFTENNNALHGGSWTGDHDDACGTPDTQRPIQSDFRQDTDGSNGWLPFVDFHVDELLYTCRDHLMTSMGDIAAYSVIWFSPDEVFDSVTTVSFDVNLTDLGTRQWWKVGVVSESLFNSTWVAGYFEQPTPGHLVSDVDASALAGLTGPDRLVASWSGGASAGHPGGLKVGDFGLGAGFDAGTDKKTRHPVSLIDNGDGTVTFSVAGSGSTTAGAFPECPCRVVFYDHNYTPDKDGSPIGHTWHWDNIVVS